MTDKPNLARLLDGVRPKVEQAIYDPGATEGYKGDRSLTAWQTDAVMRAILAALSAALPADVAGVARLVEAGNGLHGIVEGVQGAMEHGTWRDEKGQRLKDTPEWVAFYNARAAITEAGQ